jgi:hypothetical protein
MRAVGLSWIVLLGWVSTTSAGLYYSGESYAELPSQWRGFLLDHRNLRIIAAVPTPGNPVHPLRERYLAEAERWAKKPTPSADEIADLGALYIRLGQVEKAVALLVPAQRKHPEHFRMSANLGTAWQLRGELALAATALEQAVRLAPEKSKPAESLHLKLVRARLRQGKTIVPVDDLFGVRYVGESGELEPGKWAADQKKKLPADAVGLLQQLALWLPADGPLLWQLAELANAHGDVVNAAAMMEGCISTFGMSDPKLRRRRELIRAAAERLPEVDPKAHEPVTHGSLIFRSKKSLLNKIDPKLLVPIRANETNTLPWELLAETVLSRKAPPAFHPYLKELDGKEVTLTGFMQPIGDGPEINAFLFVEHPIGCWFCEMPEMTNIIYVELPPSKTIAFGRQLMRVTGRLSVNADDPEDYLYAVRNARVAGFD